MNNKNLHKESVTSTSPEVTQSPPAFVSPLVGLSTQENVQDKNLAILEADKKSGKYVKERVFKFHSKWWEKLEQMIDSDDPAERRTAIIEFNKLQVRVLPPAEKEDVDRTPIAKIINFVQHNHNNLPQAIEAEVIDQENDDDDADSDS